MAKIQARHNVDKNVARFGVADSSELCEAVVQSIPADVLKNAKRILDVGIGCGGIARAIVKRMMSELYMSRSEATLKVYGVDNNLALVNKAVRNGFVHTVCTDFLQWQPEMQFDVIIGNPPYNNEGKIKGAKQTSGTSLWLKFLKKIPTLLVDGGWSSLVLPAAVGNTNSQGWRSLRDCKVENLQTGIGKKFFKVGTEISVITFCKSSPESSHLIDGVEVNREAVPILPAVCNPLSLSIFTKICSQSESVDWNRDNWPIFEQKAQGKCVVGMSFLDRSKVYNLQTFDDLNARSLKKVNICWAETGSPEELIRVMQSKLISFYTEQTMLSGNLSVGMVRAISFPRGWQNLKTDQEIFDAYGLTEEEVAYLVR